MQTRRTCLRLIGLLPAAIMLGCSDGAVAQSIAPQDDVWPPPGVPLVKGEQSIGPGWSITLPEVFAQRTEDGGIVFWRPGLMLAATVEAVSTTTPIPARVEAFKQAAPKDATNHVTSQPSTGLSQHLYRVKDRTDDGVTHAITAGYFTEAAQLTCVFDFGEAHEEERVRELANSIRRTSGG